MTYQVSKGVSGHDANMSDIGDLEQPQAINSVAILVGSPFET